MDSVKCVENSKDFMEEEGSDDASGEESEEDIEKDKDTLYSCSINTILYNI